MKSLITDIKAFILKLYAIFAIILAIRKEFSCVIYTYSIVSLANTDQCKNTIKPWLLLSVRAFFEKFGAYFTTKCGHAIYIYLCNSVCF